MNRPLGAPLSVSVSEAASLTSLGEKAIRAAIASRELPARKVASRVVILYADLEAWLTSRPAVGESA